jgi:hypothetical protein
MTLYPDSLCPRSFCLCTSWFSTVSSGLSFCFGVLLYAMLTHRLSFGFCSLGLHRPNISSRPPWIPHHIASQTPARLVYLFILFCFGASNGYISSLGMILASSPSLNPLIKESEKDISGSLAGFCLTAGLAVGSMTSFFVRWIVRGGNPFID